MAQTKKKRKRKHRGTPAGTVERPGRSARPHTREDAKAIARKRRAERLDQKPTWRGTVNRAAIAGAVFGLLLAIVPQFNKNFVQGAELAVFMFVLYIPLGYAMDSAIYRFRQRRRQ